MTRQRSSRKGGPPAKNRAKGGQERRNFTHPHSASLQYPPNAGRGMRNSPAPVSPLTQHEQKLVHGSDPIRREEMGPPHPTIDRAEAQPSAKVQPLTKAMPPVKAELPVKAQRPAADMRRAPLARKSDAPIADVPATPTKNRPTNNAPTNNGKKMPSRVPAKAPPPKLAKKQPRGR